MLSKIFTWCYLLHILFKAAGALPPGTGGKWYAPAYLKFVNNVCCKTILYLPEMFLLNLNVSVVSNEVFLLKVKLNR